MTGPIPPTPAEARCSAGVVACQQRLIAAARDASGPGALERMTMYVEAKFEAAMQGGSVDTYA